MVRLQQKAQWCARESTIVELEGSARRDRAALLQGRQRAPTCGSAADAADVPHPGGTLTPDYDDGSCSSFALLVGLNSRLRKVATASPFRRYRSA